MFKSNYNIPSRHKHPRLTYVLRDPRIDHPGVLTRTLIRLVQFDFENDFLLVRYFFQHIAHHLLTMSLILLTRLLSWEKRYDDKSEIKMK